jgi:hypothetical protein
MLECKFWNTLGIFLGIEIPHGYTLVTNGFHILGVLMGSHDFATHFLDEVLFQDMPHIDDLPLLGNVEVPFGILFLCVVHRPFYLTWTISPSSFLSLLASFNKKII